MLHVVKLSDIKLQSISSCQSSWKTWDHQHTVAFGYTREEHSQYLYMGQNAQHWI